MLHVNIHGTTKVIAVIVTCKPVGSAEDGADVCLGDEGEWTVGHRGRRGCWLSGRLQLLDSLLEKTLHLERRVKTCWTGACAGL